MYNEYFGFRESPFSVTPDPRFFYANSLYQEAFATLIHGIEAKRGFVVITGEVGTGKTTLLRKLMRNLEATTHSVFIFNTHLSFIELLRLILRDLGLAAQEEDRLAMIEELNRYLIEQLKRGHIVSVLIDEAQNLSDEALEGLRLLSNLETDREKLLQIVLMGQPELEEKLDKPGLRQFKQRVALHCRLAPLKGNEVGSYIDFRLRRAGFEGEELFDPDAVEQIAAYSKGIPRLINIICDNALLAAYGTSQKRVAVEMVNEVARDLRLKAQPEVVNLNVPAMETPATDAKQGALQTTQPHRLRSRSSCRARVRIGSLVALLLLGVGTVFSQNMVPNLNNFLSSLFERPKAGPTLEASLSRSPGTIDEPKAATKDLLPDKESRERGPAADRLKQEAITSKAEQPQLGHRQIERKEKESSLGTFEIARPSFVRSTPHSDAEIIATLQPRTQVRVVSTTGNYFRVQFADGGTIHGYVHREDAFLERKAEALKEARREAPVKIEKARSEENEVVFLPTPIPYRVVRGTFLATGRDVARFFIPKGTKVHVAGFNRKDEAFVVSRRGNPDGFVPAANLEKISEEAPRAASSVVPSRAAGTTDGRMEDRSGKARFTSLPAP